MSESTFGFEERLLESLYELVGADDRAAGRTRRRRFALRSRRGLAVVLACLVVVGATSAAVVRHHGWYAGSSIPRQRILNGHPTLAARIHAAQLPPFRPVGPLVAALSGHGRTAWFEKLYVDRTDVPTGHPLWELLQVDDVAHRTLPNGTVLPASVQTGFYDGSRVIWAIAEAAPQTFPASPIPSTLFGRLDRSRAATLELRTGLSERPTPIRLRANGYFMQRLSRRELAAFAAGHGRLVARNRAGTAVARTTVKPPLLPKPPGQ